MSDDNYSGQGPRTVGYQLTSNMYEFMMRCIDLGCFEGPIGNMQIAEPLKPVIAAMIEVLAGGTVKFESVQRGNPDINHELTRRLDDAIAEANTINGKVGYYVTAIG
jgi:hypothetical protein